MLVRGESELVELSVDESCIRPKTCDEVCAATEDKEDVENGVFA